MSLELNQKYLLEFNPKYAEELLDDGKVDEAKQYVNTFFYSYGAKIYYYNGKEFILYSKPLAKRLIPINLKINIVKPNSTIKFCMRQYLESAEFMSNQYEPIMDFSTKQLIITKELCIRGIILKKQFLNIAKHSN